MSALFSAAARRLRADLLSSTAGAEGARNVIQKRTAAGAVAVSLQDQNDKRSFDVAIDFNVTAASSAAAVKAALQLAISAAGALSRGGEVYVPPFLNYGYVVTDKTTWPSFAGVTVPVTVYDYSQGSSYGAYPATYDGAQSRIWFHTPQTTVAGMHDGNTVWHRGAWAPNYCISNDMDLTGARAASDNRRALFTVFVNGAATWATGQGSQSGAALTNEELSNFYIQKYAMAGDTLGAYVPYLVERKTGRIGYGVGTNAPSAHHHFGPVNTADATVPVVLVHQAANATAGVELQSSSGAGSRSYWRNVAGVTEIGTTAGGTSIRQRQSDAFIELGAGSAYTYHVSVQGARSANWVNFVNNTSTTDGFVQRLQSASTQAASWSFLEAYANAGADLRCRIAGTGNITNANNNYGAISDLKLKQDIVDASSSWEDFKAYRFRKYRFKSEPDGPLQLGVIAQEMEEVSPGLVDETEDFEEVDGERVPTGTRTKQVKYSVLYLKACVVLKEALARIEALEAAQVK